MKYIFYIIIILSILIISTSNFSSKCKTNPLYNTSRIFEVTNSKNIVYIMYADDYELDKNGSIIFYKFYPRNDHENLKNENISKIRIYVIKKGNWTRIKEKI